MAFQLGLCIEKPGQGLTLTGNGSGLLFSTKNGCSWNLHLKKKNKPSFETRQTCFNFLNQLDFPILVTQLEWAQNQPQMRLLKNGHRRFWKEGVEGS